MTDGISDQSLMITHMSVDDLKATSLASSCERAFLGHIERLARCWSAGSMVLVAFGVLALTRLLPDISGLVGGLALFFGVGLVWSGALWLRLLPPGTGGAQEAANRSVARSPVSVP